MIKEPGPEGDFLLDKSVHQLQNRNQIHGNDFRNTITMDDKKELVHLRTIGRISIPRIEFLRKTEIYKGFLTL